MEFILQLMADWFLPNDVVKTVRDNENVDNQINEVVESSVEVESEAKNIFSFIEFH
ncbi:MAG: hypothetical protein JW717_07210 [Marinilabiliaceae bacterium]|nr:hypothetical protein [Marinilabiliaceae bacterium]